MSKERLIDANALHVSVLGGRHNGKMLAMGLVAEAVEKLIAEAPTVDVEPVRHGEWLEREDDYDWYVFCSECGDEYVEDKDLRVASWVKQYFNYCPYCGAKMDKRKKNEID